MRNSGVLLLGASGRLGRMVQAFWPTDTELLCHSRSVRPGYVSFDPLSDAQALCTAMEGRRAVLCLSGITPAHAAASGNPLSLNAALALAAVRAAGRAGVPRLLLASSAAVYGAAQGPLSEDMICKPASEYGQAKLEMERDAFAAARDCGQAVTMLRIGNVAGADAILGGWREGMQLDVLPDGTTPARSYIGPANLSRAIHRLCTADDLPGIVNVAAPGVVHMGALLDAAGRAWTAREAGPAAIARVELETKRLEKHVEFAPNAGQAQGLVAEWRAYLAQPDSSQ